MLGALHPGFWIGFNVFIVVMLALDLWVFHRKAHEVKLREALVLSVFWIALALVFGAGVYFTPQFGLGPEMAQRYFLGYVIEKALSIDNLFVFAIIFAAFKVPRSYEHKLLFYGVVGALIMRAIFIFVGVALLERFHFLIYVFGAFLVITGAKLLLERNKEPHPERNFFFRMIKGVLPLSSDFDGDKFTTRRAGKLFFTPLFLVLLLIEFTDLVFALDSIPAVMAVAQDENGNVDPFIVYTSNVFAILGMRSLYFALAGILGMFRFLKPALAFILAFIGTKMLIMDVYKMPIEIALGVVLGVLALAVILSLLIPGKKPELPPPFEVIPPQPEAETSATPFLESRPQEACAAE